MSFDDFDKECDKFIAELSEFIKGYEKKSSCTAKEQEGVLLFAACRILASILCCRAEGSQHYEDGIKMINKSITLQYKELKDDQVL